MTDAAPTPNQPDRAAVTDAIDPRSAVILDQVLAGGELADDDVCHLVEVAPLLQLGMVARAVSRRLHPDGAITYLEDRTILLSNVCDDGCSYCEPALPAPAVANPYAQELPLFSLTPAGVLDEISQAVSAGAQQVTVQGGHNSEYRWKHHLDLLSRIRSAHPSLGLVAFSATEVIGWSQAHHRPLKELLRDLKGAGLDVLWLGGAETIPTRLPEHRRLLAGPWPDWEAVAAACASLEIPTVAPFPMGVGENRAQRAGLLLQLRKLQGRTGALTAVVPFVPLRPLPGVEPAAGHGQPANKSTVDGHEYLRLVALCRIVLTGVPYIQASAVSQGAKIAQVALECGADDLGGTHREYGQMELAAARVGPMTATECRRLIADSGRPAVQRDARYRPLT